MSVLSKATVLWNMFRCALVLILVWYVIDSTVFIIQERRWRGVEQTHRVLRQWRTALRIYHSDQQSFPPESFTAAEVSTLLSRGESGRMDTLPSTDGFGRQLLPGCGRRGWSQVLSCGRDGVSQCGEGDDIAVEVEIAFH